MPDERLLDRREAAAFLKSLGYRTSPDSLRTLCSRGGGPAFHRWGGQRVLYRPSDLRTWAESRLGGRTVPALKRRALTALEFAAQVEAGEAAARAAIDHARAAGDHGHIAAAILAAADAGTPFQDGVLDVIARELVGASTPA